MNSRQRVAAALRHQQPDYVPLDLGGSPVSGMHVSSVYLLRQALGLSKAGTPVKVVEPYQMLGEIAPDLMDVLGIDVIGVGGPWNMFGFENTNWKPWTTFDGTPVLVPGDFNTQPSPTATFSCIPRATARRRPAGACLRGAITSTVSSGRSQSTTTT
jgi:hypothetical protein